MHLHENSLCLMSFLKRHLYHFILKKTFKFALHLQKMINLRDFRIFFFEFKELFSSEICEKCQDSDFYLRIKLL